MSELRPVGSEIEFCFPPSPNTTSPCFTIWKYRISAHSPTNEGMRETLEPIDKRQFVPTTYVVWLGRWMPVPPPECLPFLDEGWRALFERYGEPT